MAFGHYQDAAAFVEALREYVAKLSVPREDSDIAFWLTRWNERTLPLFDQRWSEALIEMDALLAAVLELRTRPLRETYLRLGCLEPATKGSGTNTIAAALALFLGHGKSYKSVALSAANELGSDTDTIGAMAGALVGAWLGFTEIPEEWATLMADYSYFAKAAEVLPLIALRQSAGYRLRPEASPQQQREQDKILYQLTIELIRSWRLAELEALPIEDDACPRR
jgi:ADP-ribosylglycohydrolase